MNFFSYEGNKRIGSENILIKVNKMIDWSCFSLLLKQAKIRKKLGPMARVERSAVGKDG